MVKEEGDNDLCRCCHNEGTFKNLYETHTWMDEDVIYFNLLHDCFDVEMLPVSDGLQHLLCGICEECVEMLQAAVKFKRQVQKCEWRFKNVYGSCVQEGEPMLAPEIKIEIEEMDIGDPEIIPTNDIKQSNNKIENNGDKKKASFRAKQFNSFFNDDDQVGNVSELSGTTKRKRKPATKKGKPAPGKLGKTIPSAKLDCDSKNGDPNANAEKKAYMQLTVEVKKGVHYEQMEDKFKCLFCQYTTPVVIRSTKYKKTDIKPYIGNITKHVKFAHLPTYECFTCHQKFLARHKVIAHNFEKHDIDIRIKCHICAAGFCLKQNLEKHLDGFHKLGKKIKCKECNYVTQGQQNLRRHMYVHSKNRGYKCQYCNKTFKRPTNLNIHTKIHTGDKKKLCSVCGEAFVQRASLKYHMLKHHPNVPF